MLLEPGLIVQASAEYTLPAHISDYTDGCTGIDHATTAGKRFASTTRCCLTTNGCPSVATTVLRPSWSAPPRCAARWARPRAAMTRHRSASASAWTANSNSGFLMGPGNALAASVWACAAQRCCPHLPCTDLSPPAPLLRKGRRPALVAPPLRSTARPAAATRSRACRAGHPR